MSEAERDCKHGQLARSCEICELERTVAEQSTEIERLTAECKSYAAETFKTKVEAQTTLVHMKADTETLSRAYGLTIVECQAKAAENEALRMDAEMWSALREAIVSENEAFLKAVQSYEAPIGRAMTHDEVDAAMKAALRQEKQKVGFNGLTQEETNNTMSVQGLSKKPTKYERQCFNDWKNQGETPC